MVLYSYACILYTYLIYMLFIDPITRETYPKSLCLHFHWDRIRDVTICLALLGSNVGKWTGIWWLVAVLVVTVTGQGYDGNGPSVVGDSRTCGGGKH